MKSMQIFPDSRGLYTRTKFFKFSEIICMVICIYTHWLMNYFTEKPKPCHSFLLELLEVLLTKNEPDPYLAEVRNAILKPAGNLTQNLSDYDFLWKHLLFIAVLQMLFIFFFFLYVGFLRLPSSDCQTSVFTLWRASGSNIPRVSQDVWKSNMPIIIAIQPKISPK